MQVTRRQRSSTRPGRGGIQIRRRCRAIQQMFETKSFFLGTLLFEIVQQPYFVA
jgi:hypothetical protein